MPRAEHRLRNARSPDVCRDGDLLARQEEIRSPPANGRGQLRDGSTPERKPEGPWQSARSRAVRRDVLGPLATEFFFVGHPSGENGPPFVQRRMETRANSNRSEERRVG